MDNGMLTFPLQTNKASVEEYNRQVWNDLYPKVAKVLEQLTEQTAVVVDHKMHGRTASGTVDAIILRRSRYNALELEVSAEVGTPQQHCCTIALPEQIKEI
jgi:hypothetical protein